MLNTCCQFANNYYLIQEKHNLFDIPYLAPHLTHLFTSLTFLFAGQLISKLADRACHLGHILCPDLDDIVKIQTDMCRKANCLLSAFYVTNPTVKTVLFRSVFLCMALHCGDCHLPVCTHWKALSTICWEKFGSFLGIVMLASFTALVVFKASLLLLFIVPVCCVRKQEPQEFLLICDIFKEAP